MENLKKKKFIHTQEKEQSNKKGEIFMKIKTRFDLIEEAAMAKRGFSLKRYGKEVQSAFRR